MKQPSTCLRFQAKCISEFRSTTTISLVSGTRQGDAGRKLISLLPPDLYHDVCITIVSRAVRHLKPFSSCEKASVLALIQQMDIIVSMPEENVYCLGDIGEEVFFILRGKVAFAVDDEIREVQEEGTWFASMLGTITYVEDCVCTSMPCKMNKYSAVRVQQVGTR